MSLGLGYINSLSCPLFTEAVCLRELSCSCSLSLREAFPFMLFMLSSRSCFHILG